MKANIALKIEKGLKNGLQKLKERDGVSITYSLEQAISNYLKLKKVVGKNESNQ